MTANNLWVTTTMGFEGYRIVRYLGVVRGITVRSRSFVGNFAGGLQTLVGGKITVYVELCEHARQEAFELLIDHARQLGANAVVGMHYDATEVMDGVTEVLAYGTAVIIEKEESKTQ
ncbi:MAG TPA: YbjQ family protein [Anaerolineaceae bacterium]